MSTKTPGSYTRAKRILEARDRGATALEAAEHEVSVTLLSPEVMATDQQVRKACFPQYGYMSPFAATQVLAKELRRALGWYASNVGLKAPGYGTFNPLYSDPEMFEEVWQLRQVIDELGISYWFYIEYAVFYWATQRQKTTKRPNRMPRPKQLAEDDVIHYVLEIWHDPAFRINVPIFGAWDPRFGADMFEGDEQQVAARKLIDQRVADAKVLHRNPAHELHKFLGDVISEEDARERYGSAMVDEAIAWDPGIDIGDIVQNGDASGEPAA
ncbi:hypothetical protein LK996_11105 [Lysobacter sp. A6]|uniref:Uncharacterized protein n=1 Tax=Noviluteimonas lactosilytica TaxID=2888523 RepID=A0ABS8JJ30_9GAMM|nr:hypothetical protein [Lysobacter lactosilyticus]MCC8363616.1 hypothetical protein [Lysobacter lactosilyticus]